MLAVAKRMGDTPLLASHPVYEYWARRYGLNVKELHWEPDGALQVEHWQELGQTVDGHPAQWMIWEGEPLPESVAKLRDRGIVSLIYDPCGNRPDEGDFLTVMEQNIAALEKAFP